jgi:hypothetical protein
VAADDINCITRAEGEIYIGCGSQLSRWLGDGFRNYPLADEVRWVFPLAGGIAAFSPTELGLFAGEHWQRTPLPDGIVTHAVALFAGQVILATGDGIYLGDGVKLTPHRGLSGLVGEAAQLYALGDGSVAALLPRAIVILTPGQPIKHQRLPLPDDVPASDISGIVKGQVLWLAAKQGLFSWSDAAGWQGYLASVLGLDEKRLTAIWLERDELWLAGAAEVALLSEADLLTGKWHSTIYGRQSGLPEAEISALIAWQREVWVGTRGGGAARLKRPLASSGKQRPEEKQEDK